MESPISPVVIKDGKEGSNTKKVERVMLGEEQPKPQLYKQEYYVNPRTSVARRLDVETVEEDLSSGPSVLEYIIGAVIGIVGVYVFHLF
jgi:hypothetical protein